jgi:hypothetical protein
VESLTQRECEQKLFELSPQAIPQEKVRLVSAGADRELKFVVSAELYEKLQRIKGLIAHAKPEASYAELLQYLADEPLARSEMPTSSTILETSVARISFNKRRKSSEVARRKSC